MQVPEISWAETEDEKNTPANSPVMNITMQLALTIFISEKLGLILIVNIRYIQR